MIRTLIIFIFMFNLLQAESPSHNDLFGPGQDEQAESDDRESQDRAAQERDTQDQDGSGRGGFEQAMIVAEEVEQYLSEQLLAFINTQLFDEGLIKDLDENTKKSFQKVFNIAPCGPDILMESVGKFRDLWIRARDVRKFFGAYEALLDFIQEKKPSTTEQVSSLKSQIQKYEQKTDSIELPTPPSADTAKEEENLDQRFDQMLKDMGLDQTKLSKSESYAALLGAMYSSKHQGNLSILMEANDQCKEEKSPFNCVMQKLGYNNPEEFKKLHAQTGIWFLGYENEDLIEFSRICKKYSKLFSPDLKYHNALAVIHPMDPQAEQNEYEVSDRVVFMWGLKLIGRQVERFLGYLPNECRSKKEVRESIREQSLESREKIFIHEIGHAVAHKLLQDHTGTWDDRGKKWLALGWKGEQQPLGAPFDCVKLKRRTPPTSPCVIKINRNNMGDRIVQFHGFVSQYATVNPDEDFAEVFSTLLTDIPNVETDKIHPHIQRKLDFIKNLLQ